MNFNTMLTKGGMGIITFLVAYLASHSELITNFMPKEISEMTIGAAIAAALVMLANYMKHRRDTK